MPFDREEWIALQQDNRREHLNGQRPSLEMLSQAAIKSELLTGDPNWDYYLTMLQAAVDRIRETEAQHQHRLCSPDILDTQEMLRLKIEIARCQATADALNAAISLPADLITEGEKARDILSRLEASPREADG